jgi:type 2 lantibiotic biosynthesis protein LanM
VQNQECHTIKEIERFYQRLGAYLALLYAINASDFHLENLIASGEHPLLIDLETLFNPEFERFEDEEAYAAAARTMLQSVLVVGMLPQRLWSAGEYGGIDISGLGGEEGQLSPDRLPQAAAAGTDMMRFERQRVEISGEANRPRLDGVEASARDHVPQVLAGFKGMYQLLLHNRAGLLHSAGPLANFEQDEIRVLLRPTRTYDQLLFESFHPDTLRDALERGLLLDRLWTVVPERPFMSSVIGAEQADLLQGDIPVFTTRPTSLLLYTASGEPIDGVLIETGMDLARRRIEQLSNQDMSRQEWFISSSLATLAPYDYETEFQTQGNYRLRETENKPDRDQLHAAARAVADRLANTAILGEEDVSWIGLELLAGESWDISPAGMDLYNGVPGIALFLAYAGAQLQESRFTTLARRVVFSMARHVELFSQELPGIGAFEGWGGLLYTLTHLGALWQDESLLSQAETLADVIAAFVEQDQDYSVMDGAAGAIGSLLALYKYQPSAKILSSAVACGDHLIASAQQTDLDLSWVTPRFGPLPLLGFGHGAAGIAWALLELAVAAGEERFAIAAPRAINYERQHYSAAAQNWPDLRQKVGEEAKTKPASPRFPVAYCFGASGIGLARLRALPYLHDPQLDEEIQVALNATIAQGFGHSHSLCHGDLGNLELLLQAGRSSDDLALRLQIDRLSASILESIDRDGWQTAGPGSVEIPGLMLGIAGIGYQMLRLAEPDRVPSILLLDPPPSANKPANH